MKLLKELKPGDLLYACTKDGRVFEYEVNHVAYPDLCKTVYSSGNIKFEIFLRNIDYKYQLVGEYRETELAYGRTISVRMNKEQEILEDDIFHFSCNKSLLITKILHSFETQLVTLSSQISKLKDDFKMIEKSKINVAHDHKKELKDQLKDSKFSYVAYCPECGNFIPYTVQDFKEQMERTRMIVDDGRRVVLDDWMVFNCSYCLEDFNTYPYTDKINKE